MHLQVPPVTGSHELQVLRSRRCACKCRQCLVVTSCRCTANATASAASAWQSRAAHAPARASFASPVPGSHELPMHLQGLRLRRHCLAVTEPPMHLQVPPVPGSHEPPMYCQCTCKCLVCAASAWYSRAADVPPMRLQVPPLPGSHQRPMQLQVPRCCLAVKSRRCTRKCFVCVATAWQSRSRRCDCKCRAAAWQS